VANGRLNAVSWGYFLFPFPARDGFLKTQTYTSPRYLPIMKFPKSIEVLNMQDDIQERPDFDHYFMSIAQAVSSRATCIHHQVGLSLFLDIGLSHPVTMVRHPASLIA